MEYIVTKEFENTRIDTYLSQNTDFSRNFIQTLIKNNQIFVNGKSIKTSTKLNAGNVIKIDYKETDINIEKENIELNIIYEDNDIIVVNKQKGLVVHPAPGNYTGTLVNALMYHCGNLSKINGVLRPGIVHRIDKDTTGIIVVCKNDIAHNFLANQFAEHSIIRSYEAIVFGNIKQDNLKISEPIGRSTKDRKKMAVVYKNSKKAITNINVLERFFYKGNSYTYINARLETGRTHQIRVHMSHIGHPLLGDIIYGYKKQPFNTQGQVLHAGELGFLHPSFYYKKDTEYTKKDYVNFHSPLPQYFEEILNTLRK
ncbi:MAG: RluA family pseudouridine synthase [Defluviitaleaceae bacterium]|nr:RluA family pseudouridine synthase [Defluviitaleaceae bacterium]